MFEKASRMKAKNTFTAFSEPPETMPPATRRPIVVVIVPVPVR